MSSQFCIGDFFMLTFHSDPTSDYQPTHHSLEPEEELDERSKIPFNFLHLPFRLIDDDIIASLDGNTVKVLTIICRYLNLREKVVIGKRVILLGWAFLSAMTILQKNLDFREGQSFAKLKS